MKLNGNGKYVALWAVILSLIVYGLIWGGKVQQTLDDTKTIHSDVNGLMMDDAVRKTQYEEIIRRLDHIEKQLDGMK